MYKMKNDILSPGLVPMKITGKNQLIFITYMDKKDQ